MLLVPTRAASHVFSARAAGSRRAPPRRMRAEARVALATAPNAFCISRRGVFGDTSFRRAACQRAPRITYQRIARITPYSHACVQCHVLITDRITLRITLPTRRTSAGAPRERGDTRARPSGSWTTSTETSPRGAPEPLHAQSPY